MCSDRKRKICSSPLITSHSPRRDKHLLSFGIQSGFTLKGNTQKVELFLLMMRVSLSILALLGSIKKNTPSVRLWDGLIPLSKVENENTSVSVPTHFERLGLWPSKKNEILTITLTPTIFGYPEIPPPKKKNNTAGKWRWKVKNQGSQLQIAGGSHLFFVLASASFGSWWHHHHASVLPGQWFGRHFVFP